MRKQIGFFGGSFNPPHLGHAMAVTYALLEEGLDKVIVMPSGRHPFGKKLEDDIDRYYMCLKTFGIFGDKVEVSLWEANQAIEGKINYTVNTLSYIKKQYPDADIRLIIGEDAFADFELWERHDDIAEMASPFIILPRNTDDEDSNSPIPNISSTEIRKALSLDLDIELKLNLIKRMVSTGVIDIIKSRNLYCRKKYDR